MSNAAMNQAVDIGKEKLRDFLEHSETGRQALKMNAGEGRDDISMHTLDIRGKRKPRKVADDESDYDE